MAFLHFTGNDGDPITSRLTTQAGTFEILNDRCVAVGALPDFTKSIATIDGHADSVISVVVNPNSQSSSNSGLVARYTDNDNMIWALISHLGKCDIFERVGGTNTNLGTPTNIPNFDNIGGQYILSLEMLGESLTLKVDGVVRNTATSTHNQTATKHGIRLASTQVQIDNLIIRTDEDILVCYGQSNMVGQGTNNQPYTAGVGGTRAAMLDNAYNYQRLSDPYDRDDNQVDLISEDTGAAGSWIMRFANAWIAGYNTEVGFIPCAKASRTVEELSKLSTDRIGGLNLYESMAKRIVAIGGSVTEVLYEQGERDSNDLVGTSASAYETSLNLLINNIKADFGVDTFIVPLHTITLAGYDGNGTTTGQDAIRQAQTNVAASNPNARIGQTLADIDLSSGDGLHFKTDAELDLVGVRMFASYSSAPPVSLPSGTIIDDRHACLGSVGAFPDSELAWLRSNGATCPDRMGAWKEFLAIQGYPEGAYPDPRNAWLKSFGYVGSTQDMLAQFWAECPNLVVLSEYTGEYTSEYR